MVDKSRSSILLPAVDPALELSNSDLFWEAHWKKVAGALVGLVVLILAVGGWKFWQARVMDAAQALYGEASGVEGWRRVVEEFPGSVPAGNARLRLASSLRADGDLPGAVAELEAFTTAQPEHPMAGAAWLALGEIRQIQTENESALEAYRTASTRYAGSYAAPLALLAEARLLVTLGRSGEARAVFDSVSALHPGTPAAMVAAGEMSRLAPPAAPVAEPSN
jgi:predicted negative regulator of RcsB-dependent stress response